jgi:membrane peptidoglycan carboxypeptidase
VPRIADYPRRGKTGVRRWIPSWRLVLGSGSAVVLLLVIGFAVLYSQVAVPDPNKQVLANASVVYWSDGKTELGRFGSVNRQSVPLSQVPDSMQKAVIAAEDRTFYTNHGFSPTGIARAVWVNLQGGSTQGGSTITQQYVKNYFLTSDRTPTRKLKEFVISLKIEQQESKATILQNYLNTIYFGRGAYGIEAASGVYFGHSAKTLSVSESALLAAIVRSPGLYDPITARANAQSRFGYVLDGMVKEGWLDAGTRARATFPKVLPRRTGNVNGGTTGYLLAVATAEAKTRAGLTDADIDRGGLRIVTTFNRSQQKAAVAAIAAELPTSGTKGVGAGLVAITPGDGAVVAMYGGKDAVATPYNSATQAIMQAGSTFKPFALAAALESGVSLRTRFDGSSPQRFPGGYTVSNFGGEQFGRIDLLKATADSVNTVYVQLNEQVGPQRTQAAAIAAGYPQGTGGLAPNAANVLGTASPHVIDVADAYATFAAQGMHAAAYTVKSVTTLDGTLTYRAKPTPDRVFSTGSMADLTYALQGVVQSGSGSYAGANLARPAAGKTGTSENNNSAWFAGYTPQLVTAVGLYRNDAKGNATSLAGLGGVTDVTGGTFPVRIWTAFMKGALDGAAVEQFPAPVYGGTSNVPTSSPTTSSPTTSSPSTSSTVTRTPTPTVTRTPTRPPTSTGTPSRTPTQTPTTPSSPTLPTISPPASPSSTPSAGAAGAGGTAGATPGGAGPPPR